MCPDFAVKRSSYPRSCADIAIAKKISIQRMLARRPDDVNRASGLRSVV